MESSTNLIKYQEQINQIEHTEPIQSASFFQMFRFTTKNDYILIALGTFASICNGASIPLFALLWGNMIDSFSSIDDMVHQTLEMLKIFVYISIGIFISGWIMIASWLITGQRQSIQCRKKYLRSLLTQQMGWFDTINQTQLSSQFAADTQAFQSAISDKTSLIIYTISMTISGLIIAFIKGWLLSLVSFSVLALLIASMCFYMYSISQKQNVEQGCYKKAGARAQQSLTAIKTIKSLNGQSYQSKLYDDCLKEAGRNAVKHGAWFGLGVGGSFSSIFLAYSLGFWFGANCMQHTNHCPESITSQKYTAGAIFTIIFSIIIIGLNISHFPTNLKKVAQGKIAAKRIFKIIDREPKIKYLPNGIIINDFKGIIKFNNVSFAYPKEKQRKILDNISFQINKNKIAFVGQSGCGKSTILQLLMRFYDPDSGVITLDGYDLKTIDLMWLRKVIGYVGQQPVLFDATIKQNMLVANPNATDEQIKTALIKAQAWEFVRSLKDKINTHVGLGGGQLSGGQKQRIAIARAILREPKILLLDEATSALDRKNQKLIQHTLNKIIDHGISISIAHRVKTIMSADEIFVVQKGYVKQNGKFSQLQRFKNLQIQNDQVDDEQPQTIKEQLKSPLLKSPLLKRKFTKQQVIQIIKNQKEQMLESFKKNNTYKRVLSYVKGSQFLFFIGLLASVVVGALYPVVTIFISSILETMLTRNKNLLDEANTKALIFLLFAVFSLIAIVIQVTIFQVIGNKVSMKIRSQTFFKLMNLPISWYENPKNNIGVLNSKLSLDCRQVKQMATSYCYGLVQHFSCLITGIVIAFVYDWRTALVSTGLLPFLLLAGIIRGAFRSGTALKSDQTYKTSSNLIVQSMTNIRTVCSLSYENVIFKKYDEMMNIPSKLAIKNGIISGFFYGIAQILMFIIVSLIFYIGSIFVQNNGVPIANMFTCVFSIFFAAMTIGNNGHMMPDMVQCKIAAASLFLILNTLDENQMQIEQKSKMLRTQIKNKIQFKDIKFKYETRSQYLFDNFNMEIPLNQNVAFVGGSGCGKSTIMSLLLRFYQPQSGTILINGIDIKDYDLHFLRSQFGVVSQEPVLFNASFKQNIKYNMDNVTDQQIFQAAKQAHAYDFIMKAGKEQDTQTNKNQLNRNASFNRSVGIKGSHISGGQKQRVAIARSLLRKPQVFLLDQATSALDSASQKKVMQCFDEIMKNKSSISIAHRFQTIKKSLIYVFDKGNVVEQGTYQQLINKNGFFVQLEKGQALK